MKLRAYDVVNSVVGVAGAAMTRKSTLAEIIARSRALTVVLGEMEDAAREMLFPDLPKRDGREAFLARMQGTQRWEAFYLLAYLHRALKVEGDVCELGTAQGYTSAFIANEILDTDKQFNLFDSFEGLSKPTEEDVLIDDVFGLGSMDKYTGTMAFGMGQVRSEIARANFPEARLRFYRGFIDQTVKRNDLPKTVCFAYVDFDLYAPIRDALLMLHPRVPGGGVVMVDDYGWFSAGAKTAVDEFLESHGNDYDVVMPRRFAGHFIILCKKP